MRIYLIGFMGSGKTSLGKRLAKKLGYRFVDLDLEVEHLSSMSIADIFFRYGEGHFRELEQQVLLKTAEYQKTVVATGGGTPCFFKNMEFINEHGVSVYLRMSPSSLASRLEKARIKRPLTEQYKGEELLHFIEEKLKEREPWYLQARCIIKGESVKPDHVISLVFGR